MVNNPSRIYIWLRTLIFLVLVAGNFAVYGQSEYDSEEDLVKAAAKFFKAEDYKEALPLYSQLLSLHSKDAEYNYRFGTCMLFADTDREKAIVHLNFASTQPDVNPEVFFFLGKAYHLNYRFRDALGFYEQFDAKASSKQKEEFDVKREMEMCNNGLKLLKNVTDLIVMEKKEIRESEFFRLYKLDNIGGRVLVKPDDLTSSYDKKKKERSVIHYPGNSDIIYFSSYGKDGANGKDIFKVKRLPDNTWAKPQLVEGAVNTPYDEDYPYMHPNGTTLYFSSRGHNSMGGYDIFKSEMDESTGLFGVPENLDFAINTPDDDLFYVVDSLDQNAYFASGRKAIDGMLDVYKVKVKRVPVLTVIIKGVFTSEIDPAYKSVKITVADELTKEQVGTFTTNSKTGQYLITLPKSGNYEFLVESSKSGITHIGSVKVPYQSEITALKQELILMDNEGQEQLAIKNLFNEEAEFSFSEILSTMGDIKENFDSAAYEDLEREEETIESLISKNQFGTMSPADIINTNYEVLNILQDEGKEIEEKIDISYFLANKRNLQAKELAEQAERLVQEGEAATDDLEKQKKLLEAKRVKQQAQTISNEATMAYNLAVSLKARLDRKNAEIEQQAKFAKDIETAINTESLAEAEKLLAQMKIDQKKWIAKQVDNADLEEQLRRLLRKQEAIAQINLEKQTTLSGELADSKRLLSGKRQELEREKKKDRKELIARQIEELEGDVASIESEIDEKQGKAFSVNDSVESLQSQLDILIEMRENSIVVTESLAEEKKASLGQEIVEVEAKSEGIEIDEEFIASLNRKDEPEEIRRLDDSTVVSTPNTDEAARTYTTALAAIDKSNKTQREKTQLKIEEGRKSQTAIDDKLSMLREEFRTASDDEAKRKLQEDIDGLQAQRDKIDDELLAFESDLGGDSESGSTTTTSTGVNLDAAADLADSYTSRLNDLDENASDYETQKTALDEAFVEDYNNEIATLRTARDNTNDAEKQGVIDEAIAALETQRDDLLAEETSEPFVADLLSDAYQKSLANLDANDPDFARQKTLLDQEFVKDYDREIETLRTKRSGSDDANEQADLDKQIDMLVEQRDGLFGEEIERTTTSTTADEQVADRLNQDYENRIADLDPNSADYAREKTAVNEEFIADYESEIERLRTASESTTDAEERAQILADIAALEEKRDLLNTEISQLAGATTADERFFESLPSTIEADVLLPEYSARLNTIENAGGSEEQTAIDKTVLNQDLIAAADSNADRLETERDALTDEADIAQVDRLLAQIEQIKSDALEENQALASLVASADQELIASINQNVTHKDIDPSYNDITGAIRNSGLAKNLEAQQLIDYNETFIGKVNDHIAALDQQAAENTNPAVLAALAAAKASAEDLRANTVEQNNELQPIADAPEAVETPVVSTQVLVDKIMPDYQDQISTIENSSQSEAAKALAKTRVNDELIEKAENKIAILEAQSEGNRDEVERTAQLQEISQLEGLRTKVERENTDLFAEAGAVETEITLDEVVPAYSEEIETIDLYISNPEKNATAQKVVNDNALKKIKIRSDGVKIAANQTTDQAELEALNENIDQLEALETDLKQKNAELTAVVDGTEPAALVSITRSDLDPEYENKLNQIEVSDQSDAEKAKAKTILNEELVATADNEITTMEQSFAVESDPGTKAGLEQRIIGYKDLRNDLLVENKALSEFSEVAGAIDNTRDVVAEVTLEEVYPGYGEEIQTIEASDAGDADKLINKTQVNQKVINRIDLEVQELEQLYAQTENPSTKESIQARSKNLENIKLDLNLENIRFTAEAKELQNLGPEVAASSGNPTTTAEPNSFSATLAPITNLYRNYSDPVSYLSEEAQSTYDKSLAKDVTALSALESKYAEAEEVLAAADSKKAKAKAGKKLKKLEAQVLEQRLDVGKAFGSTNPVEVTHNEAIAQEAQNTLEDTHDLNAENNAVFAKGERYKDRGIEYSNSAKETRQLALNTKDEVAQDSLFKQAHYLDWVAIEELKRANYIFEYMATQEFLDGDRNSLSDEVLAALGEDQLNAVAANTSGQADPNAANPKANRQFATAAEYYARADELNEQADQLENRAQTLLDSAEDVRKKFRKAIVSDAEAKRAEAAELVAQADELSAIGDEVAEEERLAAKAKEEEDLAGFNDRFNPNESAKYNEYIGLFARAKFEEEKAKELEAAEAAARAAGNTDEAEALSLKKAHRFANAQVYYDQAEEYLGDLKEEYAEDIRAKALANEADLFAENTTADNGTPVELEELLKTPEKVDRDLFATTEEPVYSDDNPIPIDVAMPSGVVFKVQVGAFRNQIPQSTFSEFAPVNGETTAGGLTRYTVGWFTAYGNANVAKNDIRGLGYSDAFVVAFYNGERISLAEARRLQAEAGIVADNPSGNSSSGNPSNPSNPATNNGNGSAGNNAGSGSSNAGQPSGNSSNPANAGSGNPASSSGAGSIVNDAVLNVAPEDFTPAATAGSYYEEQAAANAAEANQVEVISGLFYTVQIGVYSRPVSNAELFNIVPLNTELTQSGLIRYTTGIFRDIPTATVRKDEIVEKGVSDAFVTIYYNGKRINSTQAGALVAKYGDAVYSDASTISSPGVITDEPEADFAGLTYKVWIGEFDRDVPSNVADAMLQLLFHGVDEPTFSAAGNKVYTAGNFNSRTSAESLKNEYVDAGVSDAKVVPFYQGKIISEEEALQLLDGANNNPVTEPSNTPVETPETQPEETPASTPEVPETTPENPEAVGDIRFMVMIGTYSDQVPGQDAFVILTMGDKVDRKTDDAGNTTYTSGNFINFTEAEARLAEFVEAGKEDATIVATQNGNLIPLEQARTLTNQ